MCEEKKQDKDIKSMLEIFGVLIALITIIFGAHQYYIAQQWKKSEFAALQIEKLTSDPLLNIASKALEWRARDFKMPKQYQLESEATVFRHNPNVLSSALIPEPEKKDFTTQEIIYTDIYDHYFDYLERIYHYLDIGLFDIDDIEPICYKVSLLEKPNRIKKETIYKYLKAYDFTDVILLIDECNKCNEKP